MPSFTIDTELPVSALRLWKSMKDAPVLIPKIAPHAVASIEHVDGPVDGVGAVRLTKLGSIAPPGAYVKEKLIALDMAGFSATTEEIEGGHLMQGFSKWVSTFKFVPISDTSCKWVASVDYEGENEASIAKTKEGMTKMVTGVAAYIKSSGEYA